jgi:hypothetical protein
VRPAGALGNEFLDLPVDAVDAGARRPRFIAGAAFAFSPFSSFAWP